MVGEITLVAGEFLLWSFALTCFVWSSTSEAANNSTIFNHVLSLTFETLHGRDGVDSRGRDGSLISYCITTSRNKLKLNGMLITNDKVN